MMKRTMVCLLATFVGISVLVFPALGEAKAIKLQIASWNVPKDPNTRVLEAIAEDLKEATKGEVTGEITFKALGNPEDYYDAVSRGLCDIAYVGLPYTPGRFLISEVLGLPIHFPNNEVTTKAHYQLWKRGYLDKQFSDVHPLCVGSTSPFNFLWGKDPVTTLAGIKGKKIRCPGGPWTAMTEAIGGVPVSVSAPESYMALQKGTIDGILQTWPAVPVFKLNEVCKFVTEINLCGFTFVVAMNKDSYKDLPPEAKAVLDKNKEKYSLIMGKAHNEFNQGGMKLFTDSGGKIDGLSAADRAEMTKLIKPVFDKWVKDVEARGLPGKKVLDDLYSILDELGVKEPFAR
jgi:TRAP-type C4-dicarboxylate transport system substrate-binding protein